MPNPMMLTACEWKDVFVDQQAQVRWGERKNSYWHLQVAQAGTYRFELRRWPKEIEAETTLTSSYDKPVETGVLGKALPIAKEVGYPVLLNRDADEPAGVVTSGTQAPTLGKALAMAYLPTEAADTGREVFVSIRNRTARARVIGLPFYSRKKK